MRFAQIVWLAAAACMLAGPPAMAQSEEDEPFREIIVVRTAQGTVTTQDGEQLFDRLQDEPYYFRPGNVYQYPSDCNTQRGCRVVVTREQTGRYVDTIFVPPLQRSMYSGRDDSASRNTRSYNSRYQGDRYERTYRAQEELGDERDAGRYRGDRHDTDDRYRNDEEWDDDSEPEG
ncbi:MAG: hypothetical protein AB7L26_05270 [Hyphomonadaceae bacterium]